MLSIDKIICFGKNYQAHMQELGDAPVEKPVIFLKPASVLRQCKNWNDTLPLTLPQEELHYECEVVAQLTSGGYQLTRAQAQKALGFYTIGLDMTLRNVQSALKKAGHPWTLGKVFPEAAIIGPWLPVNLGELNHLDFYLRQNNELKQKANTSQMLMPLVDLIVYASQHFPLCAGDILFTGTPAGVGPVIKDAVCEVGIESNKYFVQWKE